MKAVVLFYAVILAVLGAVVANDAPAAPPCAQVVQNLNSIATQIHQNATSYWAHRANFVNLLFGSSRPSQDASQAAKKEKAQGDSLKAAMPGTLANFKHLVATAQSESCLSPDELSAIAEPTIKHAKRVNFDQFPSEEGIESKGKIGPRRMP